MSVVRSCLGICLIALVAAHLVPVLADAQVANVAAENSALRRAAELEERGQVAQAEQIYLEQERHFPRNAEILFHLGTLRMRQNDWPKAIEYLERCRKLQPRNADVVFYLAQAYYLNRELAPAQQTILIAVHLAPKNPEILLKAGEYLCDGGDCVPGLNDLLLARKLDPTLENIDLDLGMAYFKLVNYKEAKPILEAVLRKDPNNLVAVLILGKIAAYEGDWEKAREFDEKVVESEPQNADALKDLGTAMVAQGKYQEALSPLRGALDLRPDMTEAHFQLGKALRNLGRADDARHEMDLYQSIRDRDHSGQTLVSPEKALQSDHWKECERLLNEKGEAAAIAYVDSISSETQSQWNSFYMVGMLYAALQRNNDAIRLLNKAVQVAPNDADAVAFLGRVYIRVKNYEQSEQDLKRALELSPSNQIALVGMGELEYMKSQWTEAARYFDQSHTQEVSTLLLMCDAYARAGNRDKAQEAAELVRAFAHGDTRIIDKLNASACTSEAAEPQHLAHSRQ